MTYDLETLKEGAQSADQHQWFTADELWYQNYVGKNNGRHIGNCAPSTILALITDFEKAKALLWEMAQQAHDDYGCECEGDELGIRQACPPCQVAGLLGSPGKWQVSSGEDKAMEASAGMDAGGKEADQAQ